MAESTLSRLRALRDSTAEQLTFALRLVEKERNPETVIEALTVIERAAEDRARPVLFARYDALDRDGARSDPGGAIRIALLRALRPGARSDDAPLFARAATTYEHRFGEVAGDLRAAGLLALSEVDPTLAGFYAVRLLHDPHTSPMSGEPAATAARVLADLGQPLPLYACVIRDAGVPSEVVGECLRGLREIPASLVPGLVAR